MDASLLTSSAFWEKPQATSGFPDLLDHVLFQTSGSSGVPKSVALSKTALLTSAAAVNQHFSVTSKSIWGLALPLHHVGGFGVAARAYEAGSGFQHFAQRWNANAFQQWLAYRQITHTSLVPTQVHDLVKANLTAPRSIQAIVVGGGSLDISIGQAARDLGWPVLASYGMTEAASQIATQSPDLLEKPYHPTPLAILPIWETRTTPQHTLEIAGPALFSGYVIDGKFIPRETSWHTTSDLAQLDGKRISPLGRNDARVKVLGELVDLLGIEAEMVSISHGNLMAENFIILAVPDERAGHALIPIFESSVNLKIITEVMSIYEKQTPGFRRLKQPVIVNSIPRSELGKIQRAELLEQISQKRE
jgi:o-succinylbenzoate---CoA ligase